MNKTNIIVILRGIAPEEVIEHIEAFTSHGFKDFEIPTNSPRWEESIRLIKNRFGSSQQVGVGTVTSLDHVKDCVQCEADYIVTPNFNPEVIRHAQNGGLGTCIGVFTPTEALKAIEFSIDVLKVFPASTLGANYPSLLKGPLGNQAKFAAVGGIDLSNIEEYLEHYDLLALGSSIYKAGQSIHESIAMAKRYSKYLNVL